MKCYNCGHLLPEDSEFCQYCGKKLETEDNISVSSSEFVTKDVLIQVTETQEEPIIHNFLLQKPEATKSIIKKNKEPKKRFCRKCGHIIDDKSKKCTGCGKKYFKIFRFNKFLITVIILSIFLLASVIINIYQYSEIDYLSERKENLQSQLNRLEDKVSDLESENWKDTRALNFYKEYASLVNENSKKYHTYGCDDFDISSFWIYNINAAEQKGYYACPKCH